MSLDALSPLDGRYESATSELRSYFSESALIRYRFLVEVRWLIWMSSSPDVTHVREFTTAEQATLESWIKSFGRKEAERVKKIEAEIRHDVKAVEYFLKERLRQTTLKDVVESVHFGCTSEDINNLSHGLMLRGGIEETWLPLATELVDRITQMAKENRACPMLAHTHGQPATPTTFGKEMAVFAYRWCRQLRSIRAAEYLGKFNGAVGCYNSHSIAYPDAPWEVIARDFVTSLGLTFNPLTTQIESHDYMAELFHCLVRFNDITLDFDRDMWAYISLGYLKQHVVKEEVGSSIMPHKVNPIDFENSEANLGVANSMLTHFASKLAVSRLQRDLSDSSAIRNVGASLGYSVLGLRGAVRGISRVEVDQARIQDDLKDRWEVLAEAVQTVMRKNKVADPYETMKSLTRGEAFSSQSYMEFVGSLDLAVDDRERLMKLTPAEYIGIASSLVDSCDIEDQGAIV